MTVHLKSIVVNDASTDDTKEVLKAYQYIFPHLRIAQAVYHAPARLAVKKYALEQGIAAAQYDILLLTDADCQPASPHWLSRMVAPFNDTVEIVLGYGPYTRKRGFLNAFIRYETMYTAIQYFSFALAGMPYMGVGRNLAYRKSLFEKTGGLTAHRHILSGDDDLFVNSAINKKNFSIVLHPDSLCVFRAAKSMDTILSAEKQTP